jgi:hypothetical protein
MKISIFDVLTCGFKYTAAPRKASHEEMVKSYPWLEMTGIGAECLCQGAK